MKKAPKIDPETIKNGVGNWLLFFVGPMTGKWRLGVWLGEAWREGTRVQKQLKSSDSGLTESGYKRSEPQGVVLSGAFTNEVSI